MGLEQFSSLADRGSRYGGDRVVVDRAEMGASWNFLTVRVRPPAEDPAQAELGRGTLESNYVPLRYPSSRLPTPEFIVTNELP